MVPCCTTSPEIGLTVDGTDGHTGLQRNLFFPLLSAPNRCQELYPRSTEWFESPGGEKIKLQQQQWIPPWDQRRGHGAFPVVGCAQLAGAWRHGVMCPNFLSSEDMVFGRSGWPTNDSVPALFANFSACRLLIKISTPLTKRFRQRCISNSLA